MATTAKDITAINEKLANVETNIQSIQESELNNSQSIESIKNELVRVKDSIDVVKDRTNETTTNLKEMISSIAITLKEAGTDFKQGMKELSTTVERKLDAIEPRIRALEDQKSKQMGSIAAIVFIVSIGILVVVKYLPGYQPMHSNITEVPAKR